jgi:uncharacterized protein DUF3644
MPRGIRTKTKKQDIAKEISNQIGLNFEKEWKSTGSTITGDCLEAILESVAKKTGIPPEHFMNYEKLVWRLVHKSMEGMLLAIEIVNKPTIPYRMECFLFLLINSWELLMKAKIVLDKQDCNSINEQNNSDRTISFDKCAREIFKSEKHPILKNLLLTRQS